VCVCDDMLTNRSTCDFSVVPTHLLFRLPQSHRSIMSSPPAAPEYRERQGEDNIPLDAEEDEPNDAVSADSSEEPEEDEDEERRIRDGFIVDEDEEEEDFQDDERRKRKRRKRHHHRRGLCHWFLSRMQA